MRQPLVTIITPTYNHEKFISQCIKSVLVQTYHNWEMIIIDDGSTDNTLDIIMEYVKNEKRIKIVTHSSNWGIYRLAHTYNQALSLSKGDYIAILEGDDFWPSYKLETQLNCFKKDNIILSWGVGYSIDADNKHLQKISYKKFFMNKKIYSNNPPGIALRKLLFINYLIPSVTIMLRKKELLNIGGFKQPSNTHYVDYPTWLHLSLKGQFCFINKVLGYWRYHLSQSTSRLYAEQMESHAKCALEFFNNLETKHKKNVKIKKKAIMSQYYWYQIRAESIRNKKKHNFQKRFMKIIFTGSYSLKFKALIALIASLININFNKLIDLKKRLI